MNSVMLAFNKPFTLEGLFTTHPHAREGWIIQPKYDGIRVHTKGGKLLSRTDKLIPNAAIQSKFQRVCAQLHSNAVELDGELVLFHEADRRHLTFNEIQSVVMSADEVWPIGTVPRIYAFDILHLPKHPYYQRFYAALAATVYNLHSQHVVASLSWVCWAAEELASKHEELVGYGYEGSIIRSASGLYKRGRSTYNEGYLLKWVDWVTEEATLIRCEEGVENADTSCTRKENLIPNGTLGAMVLCSQKFGTFNVGSGFTQAEREVYWALWKAGKLKGETVTFKYRPGHMKDKPQAIFVGVRKDL